MKRDSRIMNAIHNATAMRWSCGSGGACAIQCFYKNGYEVRLALLRITSRR